MGYGMKSRMWFIKNPIAEVQEASNPGVRWKWDVGRTVKLETTAIPLFNIDLDHPEANPDKVQVYGMTGE